MIALRGRGYRTAEENEKEEKETGVIAIDSNFSPVTRVRYKVEETRVGKMTNYDKLVLEVWTNGAVTAESALVESAKIYRKHLNPFVHYLQPGAGILATDAAMNGGALGGGGGGGGGSAALSELAPEGGAASLLDQPITSLNLSVRARNCLDAENVRSIRQLVKMSEQDLLELRNFGQTSLKEVKKRLGESGLALAGSAIYVDDGEGDDDIDDAADDTADGGDSNPVLDVKS
jgi:DNA-directed RNA polymerase subunit alpha